MQRVLGIDTSCDETAAAVVEDGRRILANVVSSQVPLHRRFGGVVPEIACRAHSENVTRVVTRALDDAGIGYSDLTGVAVTNRPGLIGALLVGISAAKAIALARGLPLVGVNHVEAHVFAAELEAEPIPAPAVALVVSGGHTSLFLLREGPHPERLGLEDLGLEDLGLEDLGLDVLGLEELGRTIDDAAGEAFDKAAAILGLGYPGGPAIEAAAAGGDPTGVPFKRPYLAPDSLDFSFSGLKTALLYHARGQDVRRQSASLREGVVVADAAASFQETVVDVLVRKTLLAVERTGVRNVLVGGGVAANGRLRDRLATAADNRGLTLRIPKRSLCTDNAAMVAGLGGRLLARGVRHGLDLDAFSRTSEWTAAG